MYFQRFLEISVFSFFIFSFGLFVQHEATALPEGVQDHGIASPVGLEHVWRNAFATTDDDGKRIVFMWVWAGSYVSYLIVDAETGETVQIDPKIPGRGGQSIFFGPNNKIYNTLGNDFVEIDLNTRRFRRIGKFFGRELDYTMNSEDVIYAAISPTGSLVSYDTVNDKYSDLGKISYEEWPQYLRSIESGQDGWIYVGLGQKFGDVLAYNPQTEEFKNLVSDKERIVGGGIVVVGADGKIYGNAPGWGWHILENGKAKPTGKPPKRIPTLSAWEFPDGSKLVSIDFLNKTMKILDAGETSEREISFSYESSGVR